MAQWPAQGSTPWDANLKAYIDGEVAKAAADANVYDAKGDLIVGSQDNLGIRLPAGGAKQYLMVDPSTPTGLRWDDLRTSVGVGRGYTGSLNDAPTGSIAVNAGSMTGGPSGAGSGIVFTTDASTIGANGLLWQTFTDFDNFVSWVRYRFAENWTAWIRLGAGQYDAKGDILVGTANDTAARKAIGVQGSRLEADLNDPTGVSWEPPVEVLRNLIFNPRAADSIASNGQQGGSGSNLYRVTGRKYGTAMQAITNGAAPFQGIIFGAAPVTPGKPYTVTAEVEAGVTGTYRFAVGGNDGGYFSFFFELAANVPRVVSATFTPTQVGDVAVYVDTSEGAKNTSIIVDGITLTQTTTPVAFFDGDMPGCFWDGTRLTSTSVKTQFKDGDVVRPQRLPELATNALPNPYRASSTTGVGGGLTFEGDVTSFVPSNAGYSGLYTDAVPGKAGEWWAGSVEIINTPVALSVTIYDGSQFVSDGTAVPVGFTGTIVATPVRATTGNAPRLYVYSGGDSSSKVSVTKMMLQKVSGPGMQPTAFFDGDTPGCRWVTGSRRASESVRFAYGAKDVLRTERSPVLARNLMRRQTADQWANVTGTGTVTVDSSVLWDGKPTAHSTNGNAGVYIPNAGSAIGHRPSVEHTLLVPVRGTAGGIASPVIVTDPGNAVVKSENVTLTGEWQMIEMTFTPPGNSVSLIPIFYLNATDVWLGPATIVEGRTPSPFSGDTPGCRWVGERNASASVKVLEAKADHDMLLWLDAGRAQGSGSPEGRVPAPVGTRYIDTKGATPANGGVGTGAIEWIKQSGTGNTGWKVVFGDTGWRNLSSFLTNGAVFSPNDGAPGIVARRTATAVQLVCALDFRATPSFSKFLDLPSVFWGRGLQEMPASMSIRGGTISVFQFNMTNGYVSLLTQDDPSAGIYQTVRGSFTWTPTQLWPTSLPGDPA